MEGGQLTDEDFLRAVAESGARALLIGRRALILLGAPVMTADYDLWIHTDDVEKLNAGFRALELHPNRSASEARARGRYVIENGERIDVMLARAASTPDGISLCFEDAWARRVTVPVGGIDVFLPCIDDLITTKRWAGRDKDLVDIKFLLSLKP